MDAVAVEKVPDNDERNFDARRTPILYIHISWMISQAQHSKGESNIHLGKIAQLKILGFE
jgi:hypothetical protein